MIFKKCSLSFQARIRASISWVLQKAYGNNIPSDFTDPFYETDTGSWLIKPILVNALSSSEVYCNACSNIFPETVLQRHGHSAILHILSRKSIYVTDSDDVAVTETVLQKTAPFHVKGHLALINGLMMAYAAETASVENVVQAVRRVTTFNASSELPSTVEDSIVFWINKICSASQFAVGNQVIQGETRREPYPVIENLSEDIGDGCSLACLITFYCPKYLKFTDICMKENVGIADSLYNLRLVRTFCEKHLPSKCFHFTYEDLLYSTNKMRENIIVLLAELFYWFELNPASCVQRSGNKDADTEGRWCSAVLRFVVAKTPSN
ncbi:hypothetical protein LOTGIDRAFT_142008 [Lottia gigantea]|uniref:Calponin-homology (CH) domain-containing protein n=1 Tax=Lottia gigantea TaxID=225164 RepID=V4CBF0_LOTGI|nr:hypothetical protein LOTGIDRAFT_142008 [Lottia gigantea]ESO99189.1 hypothetical protein LOTGIDRAFT_142008 [Lottia gigantea]